MQHAFDTEIAKVVGVNAAAIYQGIEFWCAANKGNGHNIHDGHAWVYNSVAAWRESYPYLSTSQVRTALAKLEEAGLVATGTYNAAGFDRTTWYRPICDNPQTHLSKIANGIAKNRKPIPDTNTDTVVSDTRTRELPDWIDADAWGGFVEMRHRIKKPLTSRACKLAFEKLAVMRDGGQSVTAILDQSTSNCWAGLFEVKDKINGKASGQGVGGSRDNRDGFTKALDDSIFGGEGA